MLTQSPKFASVSRMNEHSVGGLGPLLSSHVTPWATVSLLVRLIRPQSEELLAIASETMSGSVSL